MQDKLKQKTSKSSITRFAIVCLVAFGIGGALSYAMMSKTKFDLRNIDGTVIQQPRAIKPFTLLDGNNHVFNQDNLKGKWSLVFFGFTRCGYICPTTMSVLKQAVANMEKAKIKRLPQVVFVSVDPARDDTQAVKQYAESFNPSFIGVVGDEAVTEKLARDFAVVYMKVDDKTGGDYDVDHSGTILLVNPHGQLQAVFSMPHDPAKIAKSYKKILRAMG